jgi:quercetin dioxygenase-like cupin family protein
LKLTLFIRILQSIRLAVQEQNEQELWKELLAASTRSVSNRERVMSQVVKIGQLEIQYLVDGARQGGLGLFELKVPAGAHVPPPHSHTHNEECVYVLEGILRYTVDGETRELKPGEWMSTPRGSVHHFSNPSSETACALVVMTPDIGEQYFRDVAALTSTDGPPDRTKLMAVMARYGLVAAVPKRTPDLTSNQAIS